MRNMELQVKMRCIKRCNANHSVIKAQNPKLNCEMLHLEIHSLHNQICPKNVPIYVDWKFSSDENLPLKRSTISQQLEDK